MDRDSLRGTNLLNVLIIAAMRKEGAWRRPRNARNLWVARQPTDEECSVI